MIDDDSELAEILRPALGQYGISIRHAATSSVGLQLLQADTPHVVLLDMMMPDRDGMDVCREIRSSGAAYADIPIVALTARADVTDRIVGLEGGMDDYIAKPCEVRELVARLRAICRMSAPDLVSEGPGLDTMTIFPERLRVSYGAQSIDVTQLEMQLLQYLAHASGQTFSRRDILEAIGHDKASEPALVDTLIYRIRQKLRAAGIPRDLIQTVWGQGYRLRDGIAQ